MRLARDLAIGAIAAAIASAATLPARAAPQVLAVLPTLGEQVLDCIGGQCRAELSAFCLEPGRQGPSHNHPYLAAPGTDIVLTLRFADGRVEVLPTSAARFHSQRGYGAVEVSLPATLLAERGATKIAVTVGERAALLPQAQPQHRRPHSPQEIALALGGNRAIGQRLVDHAGQPADAARLIARYVTALPEALDAASGRQSLWRDSLATAPTKLADSGRGQAEAILARCQAETTADPRFSFRTCLRQQHDRTLWQLNRQYWNAVDKAS